MQRYMCKSKIHRAMVTGVNLDYIGSMTIDSLLMQSANIIEYEQIQVLNLNNGRRFTTYAIIGEAGSGDIILNGAAARLVHVGDLVIILSYGLYTERACINFSPRHVHVDQHNHLITKKQLEAV